MAMALLKAADILLPIANEVSGDCSKKLDWVSDLQNRYLISDLERVFALNESFYYAPCFMVVDTFKREGVIYLSQQRNNILNVSFYEDLAGVVKHIENKVKNGRPLPAFYMYTSLGYQKKPYYVGNSKFNTFRTGGYSQGIAGLSGVGTEAFITGCSKVYFDNRLPTTKMNKSLEDKDKLFIEIPDLWEFSYTDEEGDDIVDYYDFHSVEQVSDEAAALLFDGIKSVKATCSEFTLTYNIDKEKLDNDCLSREECENYKNDTDNFLDGDDDFLYELGLPEEISCEEINTNANIGIDDETFEEDRHKALLIKKMVNEMSFCDYDKYGELIETFKKYVRVGVDFKD